MSPEEEVVLFLCVLQSKCPDILYISKGICSAAYADEEGTGRKKTNKKTPPYMTCNLGERI